MKIKIVNKTENKLLERIELNVEIDHQGEAVPTRDAVLARVAAEVNKERNQVVLIKMEAKFGIGISNAFRPAFDGMADNRIGSHCGAWNRVLFVRPLRDLVILTMQTAEITANCGE